MKEFLPVYGFSFLILTVVGLGYNYALYGIIAGGNNTTYNCNMYEKED